jgi:hypothetical protein
MPGATASLSTGILGKLRFGPIGKFVCCDNLAKGPRVNQLRTGHLALFRGDIELPELIGTVSGGDGKFFHSLQSLHALRR